MHFFKNIDRKKTKLFSIENLLHSFCATLYIVGCFSGETLDFWGVGDYLISGFTSEELAADTVINQGPSRHRSLWVLWTTRVH